MNHEQLNHKTIKESYRSLCEKPMNYVKITSKKRMNYFRDDLQNKLPK